MTAVVLGAACAAALLFAACGSDTRPASPAGSGGVPPGRAADVRPERSAADAAARPRIVVLGDSLTAGLGLDPEEAYPVRLQRRLDEAGLPYDVVNAGVSGDTSAGGLRRLDWALDDEVRILILALGGNDGLRGISAEELARNLGAIIERAQSRGITVILAGMEAPPNFGQPYVEAFRAVYPTLAKRYGVTLVPFLLDGVAGVAAMNQRDGIHPTAEGAERVADNIWPVLKPVAEAQAARPAP